MGRFQWSRGRAVSFPRSRSGPSANCSIGPAVKLKELSGPAAGAAMEFDRQLSYGVAASRPDASEMVKSVSRLPAYAPISNTAQQEQ